MGYLMKGFKKHIFLVLAVFNFWCLVVNSQTNQNGYNKFYYDNGALSSEGNMKDGKPDGYWKNYHKNGKVKIEGNRKDFLLIVYGNLFREGKNNKINCL